MVRNFTLCTTPNGRPGLSKVNIRWINFVYVIHLIYLTLSILKFSPLAQRVFHVFLAL